ncbi:ion channel protein [Herbiconiux ginsengi]|uniref:H+/Cl-antiporter ClcA n=1 Tax=Herbiconiux ginsengi TaxID=381665 RepID=A0A1H3S659_9MICO|nr:ion channel protein [Herbiconiux ginsengi]SDZ33078.1 H+/Cl-antiporter ClcA [Herbiconiux ginsengi]
MTSPASGALAQAAPSVKRLVQLSIPAILIGVVSALLLFGIEWVADQLESVIWDVFPHAAGIDPDNGWWIFSILTLTGLVVGLCLWLVPGHGGRDSATTELIAPPLPLSALPSLALVAVVGLAGGVSLGPENPIIAINTGLLVALIARLWKAIPPALVIMITAAATIGALFGTPVAAALVFTGVVGSIAGGGALWDKLFLPLVAAGAGAITMRFLGHPTFALPLPAYDTVQPFDLLSAAVIAAVAAVLGVGAAAVFPRLHGAFRLLRNPVFYVTAGGIVLGVLGAIGGPITLFKGLQQTAELATNRADYTVEALIVIVLVKVVALTVAAAAGFRGGRIFPSVFIGAAVGVLANALVPGIPVALAVSAGVLGMVLAVARDGWIALFIATAVSGSLIILPVLCLAILPTWLIVTKAPEMIVHPDGDKPIPLAGSGVAATAP